MREILFRGKQKSNGNWVHGDLSYHRDGRVFIRCWDRLEFNPAYNAYEVNPETVGQFTGLTDKNGKMIFEGDICRVCLDPGICIGDVIWDSKIASYNILFNNGECVLPLDIFIAKNKVGDKVWVEVIGNTHDNPELLEVE